MKFKDEDTGKLWYEWLNRYPVHEPFLRLHRILLVINDLSKVTGHGEITVTEFLRPQDFDSYHSKAQAADFRVKDKSKEWYAAMILLRDVLRRLDWQVQLVPHLELYGTVDQHIHVEVDDNSLTKR